MTRPSIVSRLPASLRDTINQLREEGHTFKEIATELSARGTKISRTAIGRHFQRRDRLAAELRRSRDVAEALVSQLGDRTVGQQQKLLVELLHSAMLDLFLTPEDETEKGEDPPSALVRHNPREIAIIASTLHTLARVQHLTTETAAPQNEAHDAKETNPAPKGLSPETIKQIMETAFGVRP